MSLRLSGKQRDYSLQTGPWSRYQQNRTAASPEEYSRRQMEYTLRQLRDATPKEDQATRRKVEEALKKIQDPGSSR